jgi:hypothetical protein
MNNAGNCLLAGSVVKNTVLPEIKLAVAVAIRCRCIEAARKITRADIGVKEDGAACNATRFVAAKLVAAGEWQVFFHSRVFNWCYYNKDDSFCPSGKEIFLNRLVKFSNRSDALLKASDALVQPPPSGQTLC